VTPPPIPADATADRRLVGRVVLVTGASRGFGRLLAKTLAGAGAVVGLMARSPGSLAEAHAAVIAGGGSAVAVAADVSDPDAFQDAIEDISHQLGPIDVLINNAGINGPIGAIAEVDPDEWWRTMEVNLRSVFTCTSLVLPAMIARGQGRIINITSEAGVFRWPLVSAYSVSKAAVIKLTENLAVELKRTGVTAFSVHPGLMPIGLSEAALAGQPLAGSAEEKVFAWLRRELEEGRGADPAAAARLVLRIAAGDADGLTGRHLSIHDDLDALVGQADEISRQDLYTLRRRDPPRSSETRDREAQS
jgi:NAD(P)-dependent dehydrogenase (short-subunit alcohol dehydrogenase family)